MKNATRLVSLLLAAGMAVSLCPVSAFADVTGGILPDAVSAQELDAENGDAAAGGGYGPEGDLWFDNNGCPFQSTTPTPAEFSASHPNDTSATSWQFLYSAQYLFLTSGEFNFSDRKITSPISFIYLQNGAKISGGDFDCIVAGGGSTGKVYVTDGIFRKSVNSTTCPVVICGGTFLSTINSSYSASFAPEVWGGVFKIDPNDSSNKNPDGTPPAVKGPLYTLTAADCTINTIDDTAYIVSSADHMPTVTVTSKNFSNVNWSVQVGSDDAIPLDKWAKNVVNSGSSVSFTAPVSSENVTLIAEEGTAPAPGGNDAGAAVSGGSGDGAGAAVVIGGAAIGAAYLVGTQVWMKANLPGGVIPTSRQQTALMLWDAAGKPQPQNAALYTDIAAAETDAQQAARWCAEQGLLKDYAEGTAFKPGRYIFRPQVIRAWNQLQTLSRAE